MDVEKGKDEIGSQESIDDEVDNEEERSYSALFVDGDHDIRVVCNSKANKHLENCVPE